MNEEIEQLKKELCEMKKSISGLQQKDQSYNSTIIAILADSYEHSAIGTMTIQLPNSKKGIDATHSLTISNPEDLYLIIERVIKSLLNSLHTALTTLDTIQPEGADIQIFIPEPTLIRTISGEKGLLLLEINTDELELLDATNEISTYIKELHIRLLQLQNKERKTIYIRDLFNDNDLIAKKYRRQLQSQIKTTIQSIKSMNKKIEETEEANTNAVSNG